MGSAAEVAVGGPEYRFVIGLQQLIAHPRDRKRGGFVGAQLVTFLDGISTQQDRDAANEPSFETRMLSLRHV